MMADMALRGTLALTTVGWLLALGAGAMSCEADLETRCVGGDEGCGERAFTAPPTTPGTGGGGGAGGGACFSACDPDVGLGETGEIPCEIEPILDNCRRCHTTPLAGGAPFPLDTYAETQALYFTTPTWRAIKNAAIESDFMPLDPPALTGAEKQALDAWICACAPPREAGVTCN
jgi:hypothetical protein